MAEENKMREVKIEKVVLSISSSGENLDKGTKLLERITGEKAAKRKTRKRIPALGVRPGLEIGVMVTLRGKDKINLLKRFLGAVSNKIPKKSIKENHFSFGIKEYIEIPGIEYQRDIGIMGFDVTVVFKRTGKRVGIKKIKKGKIPKKQIITKEEIIKFMKEKFGTEFI